MSATTTLNRVQMFKVVGFTVGIQHQKDAYSEIEDIFKYKHSITDWTRILFLIEKQSTEASRWNFSDY